MSLFFVPTQHPFVVDRRHTSQRNHHHQFPHGGRCGSSMTNVQSPFDLIFGGQSSANYYDDNEDGYELIAEQRLRQHYAALRRQAEAERERELRRRRIQHEQRRREAELAALAAAAAWQAEQERKQQQQQRALVERRRREREAAVAQQQRRQAAARAAAQQQWEQLAVQGIAGALELASHFFDVFNDDEEEEQEKSAEPASTTSKVESKAVEHNASQDINDVEMKESPETVTVEKSHADEHVEVPAQALTEEKSANEPEAAPQEPSVSSKLVFSYPLPKDESQRATIKANDIKVDFDEQSRTIQIKGLWDVEDGNTSDSHSTISAQSDDEGSTRGRKRSRSPKRSRVSDVDEKTGEEIVKTDEVDNDGFVNISAGKQAQGTARVSVPDNVDVSTLRAELTDEGFRLYL